jgi:glycosyltransferase involved in cell wall biosynthesis
MESARLTLIVTTIRRPDTAKRFLESVRHYFPEMPIILSEQADEYQLIEFCAQRAIRHLALEFDSGLSHARNAMLDRVETDYFVLTDDDYLFREKPDFDFCMRFLDAHWEFVCVVGRVCDQFPSDNGYAYCPIDRIKNLCVDETGGGLVLIPLTFMPPAGIVFEGERLLPCDFGSNWGVFRRSFFVENALRWDEQFKIGGEHFDFFLQLKLHPARPRVAYWPKLQCDHMRGMDESYAEMRRRMNWRKEFLAKWDLRYRGEVADLQVLEVLDGELRTFYSPQGPAPGDSPELRELRQQLQQSHAINDELRRRIAILQDRLANAE